MVEISLETAIKVHYTLNKKFKFFENFHISISILTESLYGYIYTINISENDAG